jgi:hypothetical protein
MARQLIVHPHFLHLTTQALGSPKFRSVISAIIGEQKGKVIPLPRTAPPPVFYGSTVSRDSFVPLIN